MRIKQLESILRRLVIEGKGELPVYFKDGSTHLPVVEVNEATIGLYKVLQLKY